MNKIPPPGSDRGTTGTLPTKRTFSSCISYGLHHYSQVPVLFDPQQIGSTQILETNKSGNVPAKSTQSDNKGDRG